MTPSPKLLIVCVVLSLWTKFALAVGPGIGNLTYSESELFTGTTTPLSTINSSVGVPQGTGMVYMLNGYLLVPFSADGAGNGSSGGFALLDISDPRAITDVFTTDGNSPYRDTASANFAGGVGEPHSFSIRGDVVCLAVNKPGGVEFWDFSDMGDGTAADPPVPQKISRFLLPGLENSGYNRSAFAVAWQGDYVYVAGTGLGLYIVDASDPSNPVLANRGAGLPNPIPPTQLGNFPVGFAQPLGNLLVISKTDNGAGLTTFDISDPLNPVLLFTSTSYDSEYSTIINGNRIIGANGNMWDISDPASPAFIATPDDIAGAGKGGYCVVQDNFLHIGMSNSYLKVDISGAGSSTVGKVFPGVSNADYDFATAAGNLVIVGDDHAKGTPIYPHQTAPDTTGPEVNMVVPVDGSLNQALTTRVGLTFTDMVEVDDIDTSSFIVRKLGTGTPLSGTYTIQTAGVVNFAPDIPFEVDSSYEVVVPDGTIRDWAGNLNSNVFTSTFSTGSSLIEVVALSVSEGTQSEVDATWLAEVTATHSSGDPIEVSWNFGDGSAATAFSTDTTVAHTYTEPGHYNVTVTGRRVSEPLVESSYTFTHTVHRPVVGTPRISATVLLDSTRDLIWTVNRDNNSVACIDATNLSKRFEVSVGEQPFALTQLPGGDIWVVNRGSASISVLDPDSGAVHATHPLPYGSQPAGIVRSSTGSEVYVSLEAAGQLVEITAATGTIARALDTGPNPRGLALSADGARLFVSRFISPDDAGEITEVSTSTFSILSTIELAIDTTPDDEDAGRGLPNYLGAAAVGPDNHKLWVPSKKDNIQRGVFRDGLGLTFENTVRPIISVVDLSSSSEVISSRLDLNDRAMPVAVSHTPLGDYVFALLQGSNAVDVIDAYSGAVIASIEDVGDAPHGLVVDAAGERLIVHNFMSRDVAFFDISGILNSTSLQAIQLANVSTVGTEVLAPRVLHGKQLFYNGKDARLTRDSYMSCASCHDDGGQDGRVWDFTGFGEGLRNTIALKGRGGASRHGKVHWSGNFDEIHDFEGQIRNLNAAEGLMDDADFNTGTRSQPLGDLKTGVSGDLDALVAYLESLTEFPDSPHRNSDGSMTVEAIAGKQHFEALSCMTCHGGPEFTDSPQGLRHDIGTLIGSSGQRLGSPLDGIDTPTLKDVWKTAPYLHNGSAATLADVFIGAASNSAHDTSSLSSGEFDELIAYLMQIDGTSPGTADTNSPFLIASSPAYQASGIGNDINLIALFNKPIVLGSGFIRIRRVDNDAIIESFDVATSSQITVTNAELVITPSSDLHGGLEYYVEIESTAILDESGNNFAAITDETVWKFTTETAEIVPISPLAAIAEVNRNGSDAAGVNGASSNTIDGSGFPSNRIDLETDPADSWNGAAIWYVKPGSQGGIGGAASPPLEIYYDLGQEQTVGAVAIWGNNASGSGGSSSIGTITGIDVATASGVPAGFTLSDLSSLSWSTALNDQPVLAGTGEGQVFDFDNPATTRYLRLTINSATDPDPSDQYGFNEFAVLGSSGGGSPPQGADVQKTYAYQSTISNDANGPLDLLAELNYNDGQANASGDLSYSLTGSLKTFTLALTSSDPGVTGELTADTADMAGRQVRVELDE
ncbi:hypothetical protein DDZ13_07655 [Coraliomargarita sinensis]|uniref:PKD domain-containing protein n=1 Tax=Coraliomargarita sinensis TaxID=2174842 RepID=A0A317ZKC3_9BACT|nr:Ig-like domain-containing protein [Coraliomargarita sinensis]PXA04398.1 hypothetical protein DDZ13_07655 [Coraliomargarita sinensis]